MTPDQTGQKNNRTSPAWINGLLMIAALGITFILAEGLLRLSGKRAGYAPIYKGFERVDSLIVYPHFLTDGEGVFRANPEFTWEAHYHINSEGFRSAEFSRDTSDSVVSILFLGDSFTWGKSATPITESFVDLCERAGYRTYNCGIPGTDPHQYAYLAEKYIPRLRPDIVAVMFYLGNDFIPPRPMEPWKNLYHTTNAGWLYGFRNGHYMSASEAYHYYLNKNNLFSMAGEDQRTVKSMIKRLASKTVIGTTLWTALSQIKSRVTDIEGKVPGHAAPEGTDSSDPPAAVSLARIQTAADGQDCRFLLFLIPVNPADRQTRIPDADMGVLRAFRPFQPDSLDISDYMPLPHQHLNNKGHRKLARFVQRMIKVQTTGSDRDS